MRFAKSREGKNRFSLLGVGMDCFRLNHSRLRLYLRSQATSFDAVCHNLTLGEESSAWTTSLLLQLRKLWWLLLGLEEDFGSSTELPQVDHPTSGILYYYDFCSELSGLDSRVYIPVRHFGRSDADIIDGLASFMTDQIPENVLQNYRQMIEAICCHRPLEEGCGIHTYIACSVKKGKLFLTSYFGPEIYHKARYQNPVDHHSVGP